MVEILLLRLQIAPEDKTAWVKRWPRTRFSGSLTVSIVPRANGKSMALTCPSQCTYRLTEVTVRKDPAQQSTQKTLKGPQGPFNYMEIWHINIPPLPQYSVSYTANTTEKPQWKIIYKRNCTLVDQRYRSDRVLSLISFIFAVSQPCVAVAAAAASCCTIGRAIDLIVAKDTSCTLKDCYTKRWHW